jgi:hypothetical protein
VARLRDHEWLAHAHDALRLSQDRLDAARVLVVARDLPRTLGGLQVLEPDDASLGLRDPLLREDDDVAVLELELRRDQLGEIVPCTDLRQPLDCDDTNLSQGRPVNLIPACAL